MMGQLPVGNGENGQAKQGLQSARSSPVQLLPLAHAREGRNDSHCKAWCDFECPIDLVDRRHPLDDDSDSSAR